jgi:type VI secretion system protein VasJ
MSQTLTAAELLELGIRPIRPESPAGDPGRDEPQFEVLQSEIRKLELPDGLQPQWKVVIEMAGDLLGHKSKDLLPACYLCVGLLHRDGYAGFATGLTILKELIDRYWETLFPEIKRLRGRTAAFEWLVERGSKGIESRPPRPDEGEAVASCRALIEEIMQGLGPKLESGWQIFQNLQRTLEESGQRAVPEPSPPPAPGASDGSPAGQIPSQIKTKEEAARAVGDLKDSARRISEFLRSNDPADPLGYRLLRMSCWLSLGGPPPHTNGQTQIPPPQPADQSVKIQALLDQGQWAEALEESESRFPTAVLWVDLHRFTATALEGMGEPFHPAAQAVQHELTQLLIRIPGLETFRFQNGQPLADERTRAWIRERIALVAGSREEAPSTGLGGPDGSEATGDASVEEQTRLDRSRAEARALARRKKLPDALRLLEEQAEQTRSIRWRTKWSLEMARLCMETGAVQTALALLSRLDEALQSSRSEDWAPDLCLEVLKSLYLCHQKAISSVHPTPATDMERARNILGRVSQLDLGTAVSLEGKG